MTTRNLAKSLHTITSLTNVARHVILTEPMPTGAEYAVEQAARILGLDGMPDVYGLKAKAAAQLAKQITPPSDSKEARLSRMAMATWKAEGKIKEAA